MAAAVRLTVVNPSGAGARAGLKPGDVLLRYDDRPLAGPDDLIRATEASAGASAAVTLHLDRAGTPLDLPVPGGPLGIVVTPVDYTPPPPPKPFDVAAHSPRQAEEMIGALRASGPLPVVVLDLDMSFWSMVGFMVKWAIAAIPALVILVVIGILIAGFVGGMLGSAAHVQSAFGG